MAASSQSGSYIAHSKPIRVGSANTLQISSIHVYVSGRGTYIALSKNKSTPPIRKNPPSRIR
jgi:hypothetical protein